MSFFHSLIAEASQPPPEPPSFDVTAMGNSRVGSRQTALEPSVAGADIAMSWSGWINAHNVGTQLMRPWANQDPTTAFQQYSLNILSQADATNNQHLSFILFDTANTSTIRITSTEKFLRSRWVQVVITYDGSETAAGLKMYLNKVEDTTAAKTTTGTYNGAGNAAGYRYQIGSVFATTSFFGRQEGMCIWNKVLTQAKIDELYGFDSDGNGAPVDISTVSFYATDIVAYWPLRTNSNCLNNATFNLGTLVSFTQGLYPFSPNYNFISVFNGIPGNTRYVAFGSIYQLSSGTFKIKTRSGTDHVTSGKLIDVDFNKTGKFTVGAPTDIITDGTYDLRNAASDIINGSFVRVYTARYDTGTLSVVDNDYYDSTDGTVGLTFGSRNDLVSILPIVQGLTYGKITKGGVAGETFVGWYGFTGGTYRVGVIKRDASGTMTYLPAYTGATQYTESALIHCGGNTHFLITRRETGGGLFIMISTDNCVTWSAPVSTGLGSGVCMADGCILPSGKLQLIYADRATGFVYLSIGNIVLDILIDPTDWVAGSGIFQKYTFGVNILGYPSICADVYNPGSVAVSMSAEASASRSDLFLGYGQIEFS